MKQLIEQRRTEFETAAKNTIIELHILKAQQADLAKAVDTKEKHLNSLNAVLVEMGQLLTAVEEGEKEP